MFNWLKFTVRDKILREVQLIRLFKKWKINDIPPNFLWPNYIFLHHTCNKEKSFVDTNACNISVFLDLNDRTFDAIYVSKEETIMRQFHWL